MRILGIHNRYQIRGGEEECYEAEVALIRQHGHEVDLYEESNNSITDSKKLSLTLKTLWSKDAYDKVCRKLTQEHYDIVHVQNFFPLISPSIFYAAKSAGVPIVQTLHNYRLICPNGLFFRQGSICESCVGKSVPYPGIVHGCYRESRLASTGVAAMLTVHKALQTWQNQIDRYIALTEFAKQKFIESGLPAEKIVVKPHFIAPDPGIGLGQGGYALFVGRLSVEKGLDTLLQAWKQLHPRLALKIVGDGPLASSVKERAEQIPNVEYLGRKPLKDVYDLMGEAVMQIFPSKWYETFGRVAIEAYAKGTPVMAAKHGAIAELINPEKNGWHFRPGDAEDLVQQVEQALNHPNLLPDMRIAARDTFERYYTAERNYQQLMEIYDAVQASRPCKTT